MVCALSLASFAQYYICGYNRSSFSPCNILTCNCTAVCSFVLNICLCLCARVCMCARAVFAITTSAVLGHSGFDFRAPVCTFHLGICT